MMSTSYGKNINISVYGGSHDPEIGIIADGLPSGLSFDLSELRAFLQRRAPGQNAYSTPRKEADEPIFLSGVDTLANGRLVLNGERFHAIIKSTNQRSSDYDNTTFVPRPSHADFAARMKYGEAVDLRGGGHFSGRLTAPLCLLGGICLQALRARGISVAAHISSIGAIADDRFDLASVSEKEFSLLASRADFPVLNERAGEAMRRLIEEVRADGDSIGGTIECASLGLPAGLGEHMFDGVENRISQIVFGVSAVKAIEFGNGFDCALLRGSQNNDPFALDGGRIVTKTNHAGGILGGMTSGMPLVFRVAMKPTPSIFREQDSVDMVSMTPTKLRIKGRHDPCIVLRAVPVIEAVTAIALFDLLSDKTTS